MRVTRELLISTHPPLYVGKYVETDLFVHWIGMWVYASRRCILDAQLGSSD